MKYDKYYEHLFIDGKLNNRFVTYLSSIHMINSLTRRDKVSNNSIKDIGKNYCKRAQEFYEKAVSPLSFLNDDIQLIYDYSIDHIGKILEMPHQSIIKEKKLVRKENLKSIDSKTINWLATKPGSSIREKLANVDKVSSTVKRYSYNVKENQVLLAYFRKIARTINQKIDVMKNHPDLFGDVSFEINDLNSKLKKIRFTIKDLFDEVVEKDYSTPNNALIGNVDYSSVWKSYLDLKQIDIDYSDAFNLYKEAFINMFISALMSRYDFIENDILCSDIYSYVLFVKNNNRFTELVFNKDEDLIITINNYAMDNMSIIETNKYNVKLVEDTSDSFRGIGYNVFIDDELLGKFYADILGFKEVFDAICAKLQLKQEVKRESPLEKNAYTFISINSYDNMQHDLCDDFRISVRDNSFAYFNNDIVFADGKNIYYNSYLKENFLELLRLNSYTQDFLTNSIVVYDINDNYDEFSSAKLRKTFSSIYSKSYPVWRSILAGEAYIDSEKVKTVIDYCGKDFSISKLERKKERFVHCGPIEVPIYYQVFNELNCYNLYINEYEKKKGIVFPQNIKDEFIASGLLYSILSKRNENAIIADGTMSNHKLYRISFDEECYHRMYSEFKTMFLSIYERYDNSTIFIIPDFLDEILMDFKNTISNASLEAGARIIIDRLNKNEITWYEKLPKLSLEVIKNGMYDDLVLVDNQECENIIGKKLTIEIKETLTLSKGEKSYILPLNKSFIGEQNDSFVAKAEDPSFPLQEDVEVNLTLEYSFGAENSYNLFLKPKKSKAPFECIEIKWEKEQPIENLVYPNIGKKYASENFEVEIGLFKRNCDYVNWACDLLRKKKFQGSNKNIYNDIRKNSYLHQNMISAGIDMKILDEIMDTSNFYENLRYLHALMIYNYEHENNEKYKDIAQWNLEDIECAMIECFRNKNLFVDDFIKFPETCYGWYFSYRYDDHLIISKAYNALIKMSETDEFLSSKKLRMHFQALTGAATNNYLMPKNIAITNASYIKYLLKIIIKIMREMAEYDYSVYSEDRNNNPKENSFMMRYCVEILISYLFVRELPQFSEIRPTGIYCKEIISCLKKFNKKYQSVTDWFGKEPNMKSKYNMSFDNQPTDLCNVLPEIYCLILYLSGDERANYIKIGSGD